MKNESSHNSSMRAIVAVILSIFSLHILFISYIIQSLPLLFLSMVDSIIAIVLGISSDTKLGHASVIAGILMVLICIFLLNM
ncbi:hypothetical protein SD71_08550 [Cohnella kolymensis]|uniref:Uncharacterized protein n=1 Tax=Cohnella kolymensis TaxID=1590652 RepID=A0ABR5A5K9_9BACL|nr:hypothetical protein SD71_08550 [Cohnella kolymensis]